jgi:hypothetical protein
VIEPALQSAEMRRSAARPTTDLTAVWRAARDPLRRRMDSDSPWPVSQRGAVLDFGYDKTAL